MVALHLRSLALATAVVILVAALVAGMVTKHNSPLSQNEHVQDISRVLAATEL